MIIKQATISLVELLLNSLLTAPTLHRGHGASLDRTASPGQTCQTPVPLVRAEPFSQKPGLQTGCRSHHSTSALERDPVLLGPRHCPRPGPSGQVQAISRWVQCPTTGQFREKGSFRWPQATGTRPRCPEAVGLTAQEPACQEFGSSGHKTGAAEGSPGRQCSTTRSGPALQTRRGENAGDGLWCWCCRKAKGPHRASRGEPQLQA